jgi:23S rRNA (guanine2445-N2)-methyltransferase / 23S rRNA (guanine2069-N7)-methyltransferase
VSSVDRTPLQFVAPVAPGLEPTLAAELEQIGIPAPTAGRQAVAFSGDLAHAYRACLWSRLASRVLLQLASFDVDSGDALYAGARDSVDWLEHLGPDQTLAVETDGLTDGLDNSHYAALRVKDAIVDQLRDRTRRRPQVDTHRPDVRVHLYLRSGRATVSLDLAGEGLHRRGYRSHSAPAPLRETLAAGLLMLAGWPERTELPLVDPMCGSGTLLLEAALIAADVAPGLLRRSFGFERWRGHDAKLWNELREQARERDQRQARTSDRAPPYPLIVGFDREPRAIEAANRALRTARLLSWVRVQQGDVSDIQPPSDTPGMLIFNPPYGKRLGQTAALKPLYLQIGRCLRERFSGWTACVLSGEGELSACLGLKASKKHAVKNGPLSCRLLIYPIRADQQKPRRDGDRGVAPALLRLARSSQAETLANRLRKNARHRSRWARRNNISCYRVYDADLPQYAAAIDLYDRAAHVQEYAPPAQVDDERAAARLHDIVLYTAAVLDVAPQEVFLKVRRRQRGSDQYHALDQPQRARFEVQEGGHRFIVNLSDYLDTGLFSTSGKRVHWCSNQQRESTFSTSSAIRRAPPSTPLAEVRAAQPRSTFPRPISTGRARIYDSTAWRTSSIDCSATTASRGSDANVDATG